MLNNELLLVNSQTPHTHTVTVGEVLIRDNSGLRGYGFANSSNHLGGSISPTNSPENAQLIEVYYDQLSNQTWVKVNGRFTDAYELYLGRSDLKKNFGTCTTGSSPDGYAVWRDDDPVLFTAEDVGKKIPIWLSYSPPHTNLDLRSCNSSSYRRVA